MKQKIQWGDKLEKDFTKLYKKRIRGDMNEMIKDRRDQILDKYAHNYNTSNSSNNISLSNQPVPRQSRNQPKNTKLGSFQTHNTTIIEKKTHELIPEENDEDSSDLKCSSVDSISVSDCTNENQREKKKPSSVKNSRIHESGLRNTNLSMSREVSGPKA